MEAITSPQFVSGFILETTISPKTRTDYRTSARAMAKHLNGNLLYQIDRRLLGEFVAARKCGSVTDTSIRRDLAFLSSLCSMAVRWGWLDE